MRHFLPIVSNICLKILGFLLCLKDIFYIFSNECLIGKKLFLKKKLSSLIFQKVSMSSRCYSLLLDEFDSDVSWMFFCWVHLTFLELNEIKVVPKLISTRPPKGKSVTVFQSSFLLPFAIPFFSEMQLESKRIKCQIT